MWGEGITGAGYQVCLLFTGGFRGGCLEEWMLKVHESVREERILTRATGETMLDSQNGGISMYLDVQFSLD